MWLLKIHAEIEYNIDLVINVYVFIKMGRRFLRIFLQEIISFVAANQIFSKDF